METDIQIEAKKLTNGNHEEQEVFEPVSDSWKEPIEDVDPTTSPYAYNSQQYGGRIQYLAIIKERPKWDLDYALNGFDKPNGFTNTSNKHCALNAVLSVLRPVREMLNLCREDAVIDSYSFIQNFRSDLFSKKVMEPRLLPYFNKNGFFENKGDAKKILIHTLSKLGYAPKFKCFSSCQNGYKITKEYVVNLEKCTSCNEPMLWVDPGLCDYFFGELYPFEVNSIEAKLNRRVKGLNFKDNIQKLIPSSILEGEFEITSILNHEGDHARDGHFTGFVKVDSGEWYYCNDDQVYPLKFVWDRFDTWHPYIIGFRKINL